MVPEDAHVRVIGEEEAGAQEDEAAEAWTDDQSKS